MNFTLQNWTKNDYDMLRSYLKSISDEKYKNFSVKLIPHTPNIIGVRKPQLNSLAKQIAKGNFKEYLNICKGDSHEEILIEGMVIGFIKAQIDDVLIYIKNFVPKINNWAVCDSFCSALKITTCNKDKIFELIEDYIYSENEFEARFAIVLLLEYYIEQKYLIKIFEFFNNICNEGYYVKMAVAWALSLCFIKFENETWVYLKNSKLDDFTYNKALQKIIESYRVDKEKKDMIKQNKRDKTFKQIKI